ncbi:MAG: 2-isopropylmalate synthase [Deltaproteobacteria bacterium]|nr:2-isopropylmalate synthase [Deltaproteobacteria bacterium]
MANFRYRDYIYDWNSATKVAPLTNKKIELHDETLRDGIQSPSVVDPPVEQKIELLHLMEDLAIDTLDVGIPGAGPWQYNDSLILCKEISKSSLHIKPTCAARTVKSDIEKIIEVSQQAGIPVEVMAFIGSSPIRQYAEEWDLDGMLKATEMAVRLGVENNLPVTYVTEDTTRSRPETLDRLFRRAVEAGASRLCLCDTVGHATPDGIRNLVHFTQAILAGMGAHHIKIDWHGHNDRALGVINSLYAIEFGCDRVHATALGIGERVGNAAMELILANLKLLNEIHRDLSQLQNYCKKASEILHFPISIDYPLAGRDAFRTGTGVHAAAIIKALKKGDTYMADRIYSGVPAGMFGREQGIEIGPMSGESNVIYWLDKRGIEQDRGLVTAILDKAKEADKILSEEEIYRIVDGFGAVSDKDGQGES